jgi:hypothetical protein
LPQISGIKGGYRFFFTSFDCREPPHVHVERERRTCKFWLEPLLLARNHGFPAHELTRICAIIRKYHEQIMEAWHDHCGDH